MRQLERKLKQSATENDCVSEHNSYLTKELDRFVLWLFCCLAVVQVMLFLVLQYVELICCCCCC